MPMRDYLTLLQAGEEVPQDQLAALAELLVDDTVSVEDRAELLSVWHATGETAAEIAGLVQAFLKMAVVPAIDRSRLSGPMIDVCGTGGDKAGFFNVSTACIFVLAAAGAAVVKHGNRGITSKAGGADTLSALGVQIEVPAAEAGRFLEECGFVFFFAPQYHPAFKAVAPVRKLLASQGQHSVFNILGPLLNPARPDYQLTGVFHPEVMEIYAQVLPRLGRRKAWIAHGVLSEGGPLDEFSISGRTEVIEVTPTDFSRFQVLPEQLHVGPVDESALLGGDARENAQLIELLLKGEKTGPALDLVAVNAGAALCVAGLANDLPTGMELARELIHGGRALEILQKARSFGSGTVGRA